MLFWTEMTVTSCHLGFKVYCRKEGLEPFGDNCPVDGKPCELVDKRPVIRTAKILPLTAYLKKSGDKNHG